MEEQRQEREHELISLQEEFQEKAAELEQEEGGEEGESGTQYACSRHCSGNPEWDRVEHQLRQHPRGVQRYDDEYDGRK